MSIKRPGSSPNRRQGGLSLIELIVFIVIVSVGIAGILAVFNVAVKSSADPMLHKQSLAIAEALVDEIMAKAYSDPDGTSGETDRALMDDVSDYAYFNGSDTAHTITGDQTLAATAVPALSAYRAQVAVVDTTLNGVAAKQVTVTVTAPNGDSLALSGYRTDR